MADEIPAYRPGAVAPGVENTAQRIKQLERQLAEIQRRDLSRANIGQGGRLRGVYGNGNEAVLFGVDPDDGANKSQIRYGSGDVAFSVAPGLYTPDEQLTMFDTNGAPLMITDELAGYGISHPSLSYNLYGREELQPGATVGTAVIHAEGWAAMYNPVLHVATRVRIVHSTAGTDNLLAFLEIRDMGQNLLVTSSTQTIPATGSVIFAATFERMCVIPASSIGRRLIARVCAYSAAPANFAVTMYPLMSIGISQAGYDLYPTLH